MIVQFYLVWPVVIRSIPARHRVKVIGGLAVAAIVWRAIAIEVMSPGYVYNATDTNAAALFVGAWLAVARPASWPIARFGVQLYILLSMEIYLGRSTCPRVLVGTILLFRKYGLRTNGVILSVRMCVFSPETNCIQFVSGRE